MKPSVCFPSPGRAAYIRPYDVGHKPGKALILFGSMVQIAGEDKMSGAVYLHSPPAGKRVSPVLLVLQKPKPLFKTSLFCVCRNAVDGNKKLFAIYDTR